MSSGITQVLVLNLLNQTSMSSDNKVEYSSRVQILNERVDEKTAKWISCL